MRAALRILRAEQHWLAKTIAQAEWEIDFGADLVTESRLREQLFQLFVEMGEVVAALAVLRAAEQDRKARAG